MASSVDPLYHRESWSGLAGFRARTQRRSSRSCAASSLSHSLSDAHRRYSANPADDGMVSLSSVPCCSRTLQPPTGAPRLRCRTPVAPATCRLPNRSPQPLSSSALLPTGVDRREDALADRPTDQLSAAVRCRSARAWNCSFQSAHRMNAPAGALAPTKRCAHQQLAHFKTDSDCETRKQSQASRKFLGCAFPGWRLSTQPGARGRAVSEDAPTAAGVHHCDGASLNGAHPLGRGRLAVIWP